MNPTFSTHSLLPTVWAFGPDKVRGCAIRALPEWFIPWALKKGCWPPLYQEALAAENDFRQMADDQFTGRN